jgi:GTP 3',8-cyclase
MVMACPKGARSTPWCLNRLVEAAGRADGPYAGIVPDQLVDSYGRVHRDLRVSVTDRCNFRCTYCMPAEGMAWQPRAELLTFEEIDRIVGVAVQRFGVTSVRLTGGEPTVRAHLPMLIERLARHEIDLALTTNGASLSLLATDLYNAGLRRVNISLDTLRPDRFVAITRRDALTQVIEGIDAAQGAGLSPVKVNMVVQRGVNDDELVDMAAFGRERSVEMRFIEFMPLDASGDWRSSSVVSAAEIVAAIHASFPLVEVPRTGSAPAQRWYYADGSGSIGVIPTVTEAFCGSCDRVRLTADGQFRTCLFALEDHDLRGLLRTGADDDAVAAAMATAVAGKWAGHQVGQVAFIRPRRSMSQIGG